jgi:isoleucyl-tRNA synthetase
LNIKRLTVREPGQGTLLRFEVKPNMKTLGPNFGARLKAVVAALAAADPAAVAEKVQAGLSIELACAEGPATLEPADVVVQQRAAEGWAGVADRGTQLVIDTRLSEELRHEGMARDVVRQVQELRKQAGLEMEDRIILWLQATSAHLQQAIAAHQAYIAGETLATQWATNALDGNAHKTTVKIEGEPLTIELRKAGPAGG